jgi:amidase
MPHLSPPPPTKEMYDLLSHHNPAVINVMLNGVYLSEKYGTAVTSKAIMHVHQLRAAYDAALENYDVLITPVNPTVAMPHPKEEDDVLDRIKLAVGNISNTCPFNVTGRPALSMPVGWGKVKDGSAKLPVGMQIIGKRWDEETILKAAVIWEVTGEGLDRYLQ